MDINFTPVFLPEDKVPSEFIGCQKCELHCQRSRMIWGEGNPKAPVIVVLDNPGAREDCNGEPFVCGTRQTLQFAAFQAGLTADDLYITYVLKCRPVRRYNKEGARGTCMVHLIQQIRYQQPKLAFCLGNTAVQWFFDSPDAEVKNLRGVWHEARGIPTLVSYHPLAVRRRPNLLNVFIQDWRLVAARFLRDSRN